MTNNIDVWFTSWDIKRFVKVDGKLCAVLQEVSHGYPHNGIGRVDPTKREMVSVAQDTVKIRPVDSMMDKDGKVEMLEKL